uniref:Secreted protein n=1 Tax=Thraustotheca clavata TaxID=74557 RepID=A0A0A7CM57_9STRA|nr:secreted protein [Thraustotheca clavata]
MHTLVLLLASTIAANHVRNHEANTVDLWQQCGGKNYNGWTQCPSGATCKPVNEWFSQCVPAEADPPLNWVQVDNVCYTKVDSDKDTTTSGISSYGACVNEAEKRGKLYASWKDRQCTILSTANTYTLDNSCKGAAKYNLDKWQCAGNMDFYGNDVKQAQTPFDKCLTACESFNENGKRCNAVMWVKNPDQTNGICFMKSFDDPNKKPSTSYLGGIACNRLQ